MILLQDENVVSNFIRCIIPPFFLLFIKDKVYLRSVPSFLSRVKLQNAKDIGFRPSVYLSALPEQAEIASSSGLTFYESVRNNIHNTISLTRLLRKDAICNMEGEF